MAPPPSSPLDALLRDALRNEAAAGLARRLPQLRHRNQATYELGRHRVLSFCTNDYLGLAARPAHLSLPLSGATASRLVAGDDPLHHEAESALAHVVGYPDAVLFPSGFQLHLGVLPCLLRPEDRVYSDRLAHASLIDGLRLSPCRPQILPHLAAPPAPAPMDLGRTWWVTESLFSMDGDSPDLAPMEHFTRQGGCLYLDEAHAIGLFPGAAGLAAALTPRPTILVGTLGKAYGSAGAFVASSRIVCHYIRTHARSFVYSTGTSPLLAAQLLQHLDILTRPAGDMLRARLWENVFLLARALHLEAPTSPIFPLQVGDNHAALRISRALLRAGFHVQPIRPPTVPVGTARLRLTVTALHLPHQLTALASALRSAFDAEHLPLRLHRNPIPQPT